MFPNVPTSAVDICGSSLIQAGDIKGVMGDSRQGGWIISEGFGKEYYANGLDCGKIIPAGKLQYLVLHMWYRVSILSA